MIKNKKKFIDQTLSKDNKCLQYYIDIFSQYDYCDEITTTNNYSISFNKYKDILYLSWNQYSERGTITLGPRKLVFTGTIFNTLYTSMRRIYDNKLKLERYLVEILNEDYDIIIERIVEFDLIKDNMLDIISLNNLFDFYNHEFDEDKIRKDLLTPYYTKFGI